MIAQCLLRETICPPVSWQHSLFFANESALYSQVAELNAESVSDATKAAAKEARWKAIPNWLVVTCDRPLELVAFAAGMDRGIGNLAPPRT